MPKLRYDPANPDPLVIREAILAKLQTGEWKQENLTFADNLEQWIEFAQPVNKIHKYQTEFRQLFQECLWELVRDGIICPGGGVNGLNWPTFVVTFYGDRFLKDRSAHPHDTERFLNLFKADGPIDPTVEAYMVESLSSLRNSQPVAAALTLGIAAERMFLLVAEDLNDALRSPSEKKKLGDLLKRRGI